MVILGVLIFFGYLLVLEFDHVLAFFRRSIVRLQEFRQRTAHLPGEAELTIVRIGDPPVMHPVQMIESKQEVFHIDDEEVFDRQVVIWISEGE